MANEKPEDFPFTERKYPKILLKSNIFTFVTSSEIVDFVSNKKPDIVHGIKKINNSFKIWFKNSKLRADFLKKYKSINIKGSIFQIEGPEELKTYLITDVSIAHDEEELTKFFKKHYSAIFVQYFYEGAMKARNDRVKIGVPKNVVLEEKIKIGKKTARTILMSKDETMILERKVKYENAWIERMEARNNKIKEETEKRKNEKIQDEERFKILSQSMETDEQITKEKEELMIKIKKREENDIAYQKRKEERDKQQIEQNAMYILEFEEEITNIQNEINQEIKKKEIIEEKIKNNDEKNENEKI